MKVIIAGSRRLPKGQAPRLLLHLLASLRGALSFDETRDMVLLRHPKGVNPPGGFEMDVFNLCSILYIHAMWCRPQPSPENPGRTSVFIRDIEMVDRADLAILFFTPADALDGYSGTYHLLDKCLDVGRPVHAYTVDDDGKVARFGDYDPNHQFDHLALDVA
jgi:hypothetical protein